MGGLNARAKTNSQLTRRPVNPVRTTMAGLLLIEFTSGVLQGFYVPVLPEIAQHIGVRSSDLNWFEGAQLLVSALAVTTLARLGDVHGYRRILSLGLWVSALATLAIAFATGPIMFALAWAVQGVYVAWLPLAIAIISTLPSSPGKQTERNLARAGLLIGALTVGAILGAVTAGSLLHATPLWVLLSIPACCVLLCAGAAASMLPKQVHTHPSRYDWRGTILLALALTTLIGSLRSLGVTAGTHPAAWAGLLLSCILLGVFVWWERRTDAPLIDMGILRRAGVWQPVLATGLLGASIMAFQVPLALYVRAEPTAEGYGLGATAFQMSIVTAVYLVAIAAGALVAGNVVRTTLRRWTNTSASMLVAVGYLLFLPFHSSLSQILVNMTIIGTGTGVLVAALPVIASMNAPRGHAAVSAGYSNTAKMLGGAVASCVFAIALSQSPSDLPTIGDFYVVWVYCAAGAGISAVLLRRT